MLHKLILALICQETNQYLKLDNFLILSTFFVKLITETVFPLPYNITVLPWNNFIFILIRFAI